MQVGRNSGGNVEQPLQIGGWLYLVGAGLCITPVACVMLKWFSASELIVALQYYGMNQVLLWVGLGIMALVFIVAPLLLLLPFTARSRRFPVLYHLWIVVGLLAAFIDTVVVHMIRNGASSPPWATLFSDFESGQMMSTVVQSSVIWAAYVGYSKRVKRTFVR